MDNLDNLSLEDKIDVLVERVAMLFAWQVRHALGTEELREVIRRNESNGFACATHDFIDANELMDTAMVEELGDEYQYREDIGDWGYIWGEAWARAKNRKFWAALMLDRYNYKVEAN